eukprot:2847282-Rhodomonas_salina.1
MNRCAMLGVVSGCTACDTRARRCGGLVAMAPASTHTLKASQATSPNDFAGGGQEGSKLLCEEEELPRDSQERRTGGAGTVSYTHLRAHETEADL